MNKKLPKIYKGNDFSHINNNKRVFYSSIESNTPTSNEKENNIINKEYILNTPVVIETNNNNILKTKIISKIGDHILTSTNKVIELKDIKSIKSINL